MTVSLPSTTAVQQRVIRVFVSSTFRDMQQEREELVKRVFPQLRKLCEERGVTWGEVDLRWGVTDEQKAEGKVLPICLAEIQRCRPYFIGLLGERYGWVPDQISQELIEQEPWLAEHPKHSVTELEILHGVLNNPAMADHTLFYFRDSSFVKSLPSERQSDYLEIPTAEEIERTGLEEAELRAEDRRRKLIALKARIRQSLPVRENYPSPQALGEMVLRDLTAIIDRLYPEGSKPDFFDREALDHETFAQSRARIYIGRQSYFDRLDQHARGHGPPLVILGKSGSGKSALLSNWALRYRQSHPEIPLVMHFIGATGPSTHWIAIVMKLAVILERHFKAGTQILDSFEEIGFAARQLANSLRIAANKGRMVIILDGLNLLDDDLFEGLDLWWLPAVIPPNIRLIVSTLPGRPLDETKKRGWPTMQVDPLGIKERRQLIQDYLAQYTKALSRERVERIAAARRTENPLYLRVLLEELRMYGDHSTLDKQIEHYLSARNVVELYERILERWEQDYERDRTGLVRDVMSLLWAGQLGVSEGILLDMLGSGEDPLPQAIWSPLHLAAEQSLVSHGGEIGFCHDYLRQAVEKRYLPAEQQRQAIHLRLADYSKSRLEEHGSEGFRLEELMYHLAQARAWPRLAALLADPPIATEEWKLYWPQVKKYWFEIEANSPLRMVDTYRRVIDAPAEYPNHGQAVTTLLMDAGHLREAELLQQRLLDHYRQRGDREEFAARLRLRAEALMNRGDMNEALTLLKEEETMWRKIGDQVRLANCLDYQAKILKSQADPEGAMELYEEARSLYRESGCEQERADVLGSQAGILCDWGELDQAMELYKEQEAVCRKIGDDNTVATSLRNQGVIRQIHGDFDGAMSLHKEHERIVRDLGNMDELAWGLGNQALILVKLSNLDGAMRLHKEEEQICRELEDKTTLAHSLGNQAQIHFIRREIDEAMRLRKEEELICRNLGDPKELARCLANQALVVAAGMKQPREALALAEEAYGLVANDNPVMAAQVIEPILNFVESEIKRVPPATVSVPTPLPGVDARRAAQLNILPPATVSVPTPLPGVDARRAAQLNIQYQRDLSRWKALPWWKRLTVKEPEPPTGI